MPAIRPESYNQVVQDDRWDSLAANRIRSVSREAQNVDARAARSTRFSGSSYASAACLIFILLCGWLLRYRAADHPYISQWDEAYHALVAKNLVSHPLRPTLHDSPLRDLDYRNWTGNHIWLHKPPMALWLMAGSIAVGGRQELVFRLPSVVLGTVSVLLTFLVGRALFGELAGLVAAALHAVNPLCIRLASGTVPTDHVDAILVFAVELTWWLLLVASSRRLAPQVLAGVALGVALLTKSLPAAIALTGLLPFWDRQSLWALARPLTVVLLVAAVIVLPWKIYAMSMWPEESAFESRSVFQHLSSTVEEHAHSASWYLELIPAHFGGMLQHEVSRIAAWWVILGSTALAAAHCWARRSLPLAAVLLWAVVPYVVFSLTPTKLYSYVAIAVPAVLLLVGYAASVSLRFVRSARFTDHDLTSRAFIAMVGAMATIHFASVLSGRLTADYSTAPWNRLYHYGSFRSEMLKVQGHEGNKVIFNVGDRKEIQAMYYSDAEAYADVPSPAEVADLLDAGYRLYLVTDSRRRHQEQIDRLEVAGLLGNVTLIEIPRPTEQVAVSPYLN